jgi:hypothetical protein
MTNMAVVNLRHEIGMNCGIGALLIMDPIVARLFVERGTDTKQKLIDWWLPPQRLSGRCRFSQVTFAETHGNGRDAP